MMSGEGRNGAELREWVASLVKEGGKGREGEAGAAAARGGTGDTKGF